MLREFALPDLGEGLTESEIVTWHVAVGDTVALNQVIADVETAKATVELPSPFAGTITALHAEPGRTVAVGAPLLSIDVQDAADDAPTLETPEPTLVGYGAKAEVTTARRRRRTMPEPSSPITSCSSP